MIQLRSVLAMVLVSALAGSVYAAEPVKPFVSTVPTNIFSAVAARPTGPIIDRNLRPQLRIDRYPAPVLSGVVIDDKDYVAFLENGGKVTLARAGAKIPQPAGLPPSEWPVKNQGTITEITLFYVMVQPADGSAPRRVDVGRNLADDVLIQSTVMMPAPTSAPDALGSATAAPLAPKTNAEAPVVDPNDDPVTAAMKAKRAAAMGATPPAQP